MDIVKYIHVTTALLSISGFIARGILLFYGSHLLQTRWVKLTPHVNDTVLLLSAIILASQWGWAALEMPWLQAKIIALIVYVLLGSVALHSLHVRLLGSAAWVGAIIVFAYIVAVATSRNPLIFY